MGLSKDRKYSRLFGQAEDQAQLAGIRAEIDEARKTAELSLLEMKGLEAENKRESRQIQDQQNQMKNKEMELSNKEQEIKQLEST